MKVTVRGGADAVRWMERVFERSSAVDLVDCGVSADREIGFAVYDIDVTQKRRERRTADETAAFREEVWRLYLDEHLSQAEISRRMECSRAYVSRIIAGDY